LAGLTIPVVDARTGEIRDAQIFVEALGARHLIHAEATWTQALSDWIGAHVRMLEYVCGVPTLIVPDNLKEAAVTTPCFYEPVVHATYQGFATPYGTAILPARAYHLRDKAKVETALQIVEREILAPLRHDVFHTLAAPQHAITFARECASDRLFQTLARCRRSAFAATEQAALRPLPRRATSWPRGARRIPPCIHAITKQSPRFTFQSSCMTRPPRLLWREIK
jgi:transposase